MLCCYTAAPRHTAWAGSCEKQRHSWLFAYKLLKAQLLYGRFPFPVISARPGGKLWASFCSYSGLCMHSPSMLSYQGHVSCTDAGVIFCWKWWIPGITKARKLSVKSLCLRERKGSCREHLSLWGPCHDLHLRQGIIKDCILAQDLAPTWRSLRTTAEVFGDKEYPPF